jgi:hypothetical protein
LGSLIERDESNALLMVTLSSSNDNGVENVDSSRIKATRAVDVFKLDSVDEVKEDMVALPAYRFHRSRMIVRIVNREK